MNMKAIAIDFDGVIHRYSKGWHDGTIYDKPIPGAFAAIRGFMETNSVFILSTRSPWQIKRWIEENCIDYNERENAMSPYTCRVIPFWKKFWDVPNCLGITRRKLPALMYIDDRAVKFEGSWTPILESFIHPSYWESPMS